LVVPQLQYMGFLEITLDETQSTVEFEIPESITYASGVANVSVDANGGEVEYFNLQGIRVKNPANGIYIRRQGKNVSKVLVK